jgi:hypothetical protein
VSETELLFEEEGVMKGHIPLEYYKDIRARDTFTLKGKRQ